MPEQPEPFGVFLRRIRAERGLSIENLALDARVRHGEAPSVGYLGRLERGERPPTPAVMEAIADVLGLPPEVFIEYRLAAARRLFDERELGLTEAAENLQALQDAGEALVAQLEHEFEQLGKGASPSGKTDPARQGRSPQRRSRG